MPAHPLAYHHTSAGLFLWMEVEMGRPRLYWTCTVEGCERKHHSKGYCMMHKSRIRRFGTIELTSKHLSPPEERFHDKYIPVTETGCWLWISCCNGDGYALISANGKSMRAHRLSWEMHRGPIPRGLFVLHKCDTPECVNPDHLFLGTNQDNMDDAKRKGRIRNGTTKER